MEAHLVVIAEAVLAVITVVELLVVHERVLSANKKNALSQNLILRSLQFDV
jgi:hypothetical protein